MKSLHLKLSAYSAFAASIFVHSKAGSQVVIKNFEPDLRMMNWVDDELIDDVLTIDIDENGINDLIFDYNISGGYNGSAYLEVQFADAVLGILNTGGPSFLNYDFSSGDFVSGTPEDADTEKTLGAYWRYSSGYGFISTDWKLFTINDYLGLYIQLDGEIHYGWLRLSIRALPDGDHSEWRYTGSPLTIYEVGYNLTPFEPINCNAGVLPEDKTISQANLSDVTDEENLTDLSFSFYAQTIIDYSELRFYLVSSREETLNFSVEEALALDPSRYYSILPDMIIPDVFNSFHLPEGLLDISGNAFSPDAYYSGFYLKIPLAADTSELSLSTPLLVKKPELQHCALDVSDISLSYSIEDESFHVYFSTDSESPDINAYAAGVVLENTADNWYYYGFDEYDNIDTIVGVISFPNTGPGEYDVPLTGLEHDVFGNPLYAGWEYHPVVVGLPDGHFRDLICLRWDYSGVKYLNNLNPEDQSGIVINQLPNNEILINAPDALNHNFHLELQTISSQILRQEFLNTTTQIISIQNLPPGMYIVIIKDDVIPVAASTVIVN